jgi:hypothetical protein
LDEWRPVDAELDVAKCRGGCRVELVSGTDLGRAEAGGWSAGTTGGASPGGGTQHGQAVGAQAGPRSMSRGDAVEGGVRPGAEARSALNEQVTQRQCGRGAK